MGTPKISIYLDTRYKKQSGCYPVKLRVFYDDQRKLYNTDFELTEETFDKAYHTPKPRGEYKEIRLGLTAIENRAGEVVKEMNTFSFAEFEKRMFRGSTEGRNVIWYYDAYIQKLKQEGRLGTAESYQQSINSLKAFVKASGRRKEITHISFEQVTPDFLQQYENWMLDRDKSRTTVGIYLRPLRAIFNSAIAEGAVDKDLYPFSRRKYQVPAGRNVKKALSREQLKTLFHFPIKNNPFAAKARDFWFLSYQCNGMNIRDIAELKMKNLSGEIIQFVRTKTQHSTKGNTKPIIVPITPFIRKIIAKHGNPKAKGEDYVFPILNGTMSEEKKRAAVKNFTRFINQHIKPLAQSAGIDEEISTYWARHSFTTAAIRNGASMEFVQESLGHNDLKTTMNYWGGFEDGVKREIADKLMDF